MSFNPLKYSSSRDSSFDSQDTRDESLEVSNEVVEKGHKNILKVDIGKFEQICLKFREKYDLKIKNLTGEDRADFDLVVNYVHLLYGTSYYSHLYEKVRKHFRNVTNIRPGTLGSYFAGCLNGKDRNDISVGCSLGCAGSMPKPKEEDGWSFCDKAVIMAEKGENGYIFSVVKPGESQADFDPAYVFIEGGNNKNSNKFTGFNKLEKANLKSLGCKKVKLVSYSEDMTYSDVYDEAKSVDEIDERKETYSNQNFTTSNSRFS